MPFILIIPFLTTFILNKKGQSLKNIVNKNILVFLGISLSLISPVVYYSNKV
jgi:hypothetical protein